MYGLKYGRKLGLIRHANPLFHLATTPIQRVSINLH